MREFLEQWIKQYDLYDCHVIVYRDNQIVVDAFQANEDIPITYTPDRFLRVASISKLFVATAIMILRDQGHLDLDDPVDKHLSFRVVNPHHPTHPITIKMLLTHTSSLQDTSQLYIPYNQHMKELFEVGGLYHSDDLYLKVDGTYLKPGQYFYYYNTGYQLLATVIETISNIRFDHYIQQMILTPLGMKGSFHRNDPSIRDLVRPTYRKHHHKWVPQFDDDIPKDQPFSEYVVGTNGSLFGPQGGLRTNARELTRFMDWMFGSSDRVLSYASRQEMMTIHVPLQQDNPTNEHSPRNNGLGFNIMTPTSDNRLIVDTSETLIGHQGIAYGLYALWFMNPDTHNGFICIVSGHGKPVSEYQGSHSAFLRFQEDIATYIDQTYWR